MKRVALYARVSSERQAQQETIESQIAALRQRATADGYPIAPPDVYADDGFSGATLARPALERLRDRVAEGGLDRLYIESPDRLARRYAYQVLLLEEFKARNVEVVFLTRPSGESAEDALLVQVQGMLAEYERARLAERCRRGKLHLARAGKVSPLSAAPYGYRYVRRSEGESARYDVLLPEAQVVREIFDAFVHQQMPLEAILRMLNDRHVPARRGGLWKRATLHFILKNPAYMGQAAYGKTEVYEPPPPLRPRRPRSTRPRQQHPVRRTPRERWIPIGVPSLVSAELFAAAQEQLARNRKLSQRHAKGQVYLLQGLVACARCGYAFCGVTSAQNARGDRYRYYVCLNRRASSGYSVHPCCSASVRAEELDAQVWSSVCQVLQEPERVEQEWQRRLDADGALADARSEQEQAQRWAATQERALGRLLDAYEVGALPLEELTPRVQRLREQIHAAHERVKSAQTKVTESTTLRLVVGRLEAFAQQVREGLEQLDWNARRQIIRMLVARIEIGDEQVTIVYRLPPSGPPPDGAPPASAGGSPFCRLSQGRQVLRTASGRAWKRLPNEGGSRRPRRSPQDFVCVAREFIPGRARGTGCGSKA
jgi:site-specific DNA recombinase